MRLTLAEAIPLVHALVADAAERAGTRLLFIKGLSLQWHGLRDPRVSADVDVLLPHRDVDTLLAVLSDSGWRPRLGEFNDFPFPHHSVTLIHDQWPCDIDVHRQFPGFLAEPDHVFDALWDTREMMPVAAHEVPVPGAAASILVMALHSVRSTPDNPRHARELQGLVQSSPAWGEERRDAVAHLASATGAAKALESVLPAMGIRVDIDPDRVSPDALKAWQQRITGRAPAAIVWLKHVAAGSPTQWPSRVRDALWPAEEQFRAGRGDVPPGQRALNRARVLRLTRGLRGFPRALMNVAGVRGRNVIDDVGAAEK